MIPEERKQEKDLSSSMKNQERLVPAKTSICSYGCDLGATRDVGELFIEECSKTLTNGSCPWHHNHVVIVYED